MNKKFLALLTIFAVVVLIISLVPITEAKVVRKAYNNNGYKKFSNSNYKPYFYKEYSPVIPRKVVRKTSWQVPKLSQAKIPTEPDPNWNGYGQWLTAEPRSDSGGEEPMGSLDISQWPVYDATTPSDVWSVAIDDVDGDGDKDLVVGLWARISIYYNNGALDISSWPVYDVTIPTGYVFSVAIDDIDGDGNNDIVAGLCMERVSVYYNNGALDIGSWPVYSATTDINEVFSVAIGDVDGDGDNDIVTGLTDTGRKISVYYNNGNLDISQWPVYSVTTTADVMSVAIGDIDGDGDNDVIAGLETFKFSVYYNNGALNIASWPVYDATINNYAISVSIDDIDGDGDNDIVLGSGIAVVSRVSVYYNNGALDIDNWPVYDIKTAGDTYTVAIRDIDNDGDNDVVAGLGAALGDRVSVYNNTGTLDISQWPVYNATTVDDARSIAIGDIDNDGDNDIVVGIGELDIIDVSKISVYYNNLI